MPTLNHPRIPNVSVDVPGREAKRWEAQGWVSSSPKPEPAPVMDEPEVEAEEPPKKKAARRKK